MVLVVAGCSENAQPDEMVIGKPTPARICQLIPPMYPGCECPPAPCTSGAIPQIVVTYASETPKDGFGNPILLPSNTSHSDKTGKHREPLPTDVSGVDWPDSAVFTVEVDTNGVRIGNQTVRLSLVSVDSGGAGSDSVFGHHHISVSRPKPVGRLSVDTVQIGSSGVASVTYTAGQVSGPVVLVATALGVDTVRKRWTIGVSGLQTLSDPNVALIGTLPWHPDNHYGTVTMNTLIAQAAAIIASKYQGKLLVVNDMSLRYGGKFDLDTLWTNNPKRHVEHRLGNSADIRVIPDSANHALDGLTTEGQQRTLTDHWDSIPGANWIWEATPRHIHLRYWGAP